MKTSTAIATLPPAGAARRHSRGNLSGAVAVAEPRLIAARVLADDVATMLDSFRLPDDESKYPGLLERLPTESEFANNVATLERALNEPASTDQLRAMIVLLLDGLNCPAGAGAKSRIAAFVIALQSDVIVVDGENQPVPISAEVLAATIARLFRKAKRAPLPSELLAACTKTRNAVERLLHRLQDTEGRSADLRAALQWRIDGRDHDGAGEGDAGHIPW